MDLSTTYLGLKLPHPFMPGASPMVEDLDTVKRLEDAGAAAIVMNSLFEEQIVAEQVFSHQAIDLPADSYAESLSYFPNPEEFVLGPDEYVEQLARIKRTVKVPVIASLNAEGYWLAPLGYNSHPYKGDGAKTGAPGNFATTHVGDETDTSPYTPKTRIEAISTAEYLRNMNVLIQWLGRKN